MTRWARWRTAAFCAALWTSSLAAQPAAPASGPAPAKTQRAELWNSEQFVLPSRILGRDMLVQVVKPLLPQNGKVPAVYLLDGNLYTAFAINPMMGAFTGEYAPAYFIGIGYVEQSPLHWTRQRSSDLLHASGVALGDNPMLEGVRSGGGAMFQRFLVDELRPALEARYPIDAKRTVLTGISFGGLFAAHVLLDQPEAFGAYLIGSPALWAEPGLVARARTARLPGGVQVFVSAGGAEEAEQVADARKLAAALRANPSRAEVTEWIVPDEAHSGFAPAFFGRAFRTVLPPTGPQHHAK